MRKLRIAFLFCILILVGIFSAPAQNTDDQTVAAVTQKDDRYRIGFQDVLTVQVFRHPELDQRAPVGPSGTITLFRLDKPVTAVCKTQTELATDIAAAYKTKFIRDPQVLVTVSEQKSQSIAVIGAVVTPANYFVTKRYHLLEMLALAGGPNKEAGTRMMVARTGSTSDCKESPATATDGGNPEVLYFKIRDVQEGKTTLLMQPGDIVSVLESDIVYVYGNVNKQGPVKIKEPITLTQAIVSAEGLLPAAKKEKVRILRQTAGNAERTELIFDMNLIDKGKVKDPILEPNDIVAVSQDAVKSILRGITSTLKTSLPSAVYRIPMP